MELSLRPYHKNNHPLSGILIRGASAKVWAVEADKMGFSMNQVTIYPLPDLVANSVWGCLLVPHPGVEGIEVGKNNRCQLVSGKLFIPENSTIYPKLSEEEVNHLFPRNQYVFHPHFGLVELEETFDWSTVIEAAPGLDVDVRMPARSIEIPTKVNRFLINPVPPEEVLKKMEEEIFPKKEKMKDKPLNLLEKVKLRGLRALFKKADDKGKEGTSNSSGNIEQVGKASWLDKILGKAFSKKTPKWLNKLEQDYEDLEERNQKEVDKLLDMFKKNPKEALKYALPLNEGGAPRGGTEGLYQLSKLWAGFNIFGNDRPSQGGGSSVLGGDYYTRLHTQYHNTAQELIKNGEYMEAAFIYMKLLKSPYLAAQTLENGKRYQEAASLYLKQPNMKEKAAECYEKGNMFPQAIDIYKELNDKEEKIGDLYYQMNDVEEGNGYYYKAVDKHTQNDQYVKASLIQRDKLRNLESAQNTLMDGWRQGTDGQNCLQNYFDNIGDTNDLAHEIDAIYERETNDKNKGVFLQVLKHEHGKNTQLAPVTRQIAYEIISEKARKNPGIVSELKAFKQEDKIILKDLIYYKRNKGV